MESLRGTGRVRRRALARGAVAAVLVCLSALVTGCVVFRVEGGSMDATLRTGDRLLVRPVSAGDVPLRRHEVVVAHFPDAPDPYVKRVIGLPGETVMIRDGVTYIDGALLPESYLAHPAAEDFGPVRVEAGHYFLMGDNRATSLDSRAVGTLSGANIVGRAQMVIWPPGRFQVMGAQ